MRGTFRWRGHRVSTRPRGLASRLIFSAGMLVLIAAVPPSSVSTEGAMRMLLAAAPMSVPPSSTCYGMIPGVPRPTLGDMLAIPLAALDRGANRVSGGCRDDRCRIRITHSAGEDVFSYDYRFRAERGAMVPASLECFSTP